jgi:hypothetical protein
MSPSLSIVIANLFTVLAVENSVMGSPISYIVALIVIEEVISVILTMCIHATSKKILIERNFPAKD